MSKEIGQSAPPVFLSYSWDDDNHREWVRALATRLRADGVAVSLDRWALVPGDQLTAFMERAIRESLFVVIVCTPRYKHRSDAREGGVGYEGDIMTAEAMSSQNQRKFIPVLRSGTWEQAAPSWLRGKYHINLSGNPFGERNYEDLVRTLLGVRETAPPIGKPMVTINKPNQGPATPATDGLSDDDVKITRVIVEDITQPRMTELPALHFTQFHLHYLAGRLLNGLRCSLKIGITRPATQPCTGLVSQRFLEQLYISTELQLKKLNATIEIPFNSR